METNNQNTKDKLCKVALEKMMIEAKKEASAEFESFPGKVKIDFEYSNDGKEVILSRLLYEEYLKYDKIFNINDMAKANVILLNYFTKTKEIYDDDLNLNKHGYDGQLRRIMEQLLVLKKIEYLQDLLANVESTNTNTPTKKIEWLGTPSEFGLLFNELEKAGYIKKLTHKRTNYKDSWAHTAQLLFNTFSIPNLARTGETSPENLRKEVGKPTISDKDHGFFKITRPNHK